jgi:uncharacterized membrane protein YcaP (DUF421 family)
VFTRILGKKQISQLTLFEYILGIVLGELTGFLVTDLDSHFTHGLIALSVWFAVPFSLELLTLKSRKLHQWLQGKGRIMIEGGKILENNLQKERLTADELLEQLRNKNVFRIADVEFAVMETNGELSVLLKQEKQPATSGDLNIRKPLRDAQPQTVLVDGQILNQPLWAMGLTREWLNRELDRIGAAPEDVFIGQVDAHHKLYVDFYDDNTKILPPNGKALMMSNLKKIQADMEFYAESAGGGDAETRYRNHAQTLEHLISDLKR